VAWSPDGAWIATSGASRTVRLLRASDLSLHSIIPAPDQRTLALDFDPSSRWLAFAGDLRFLWVVDVTDPSNRRGLSLDHSVWGLKWNPDGRRIAIADRGSGVRIVDAAPDGSPLKLVGSFSGHHNEVWCVDWSPSGERLYSSGQMEAHAWTSMPRVGPVRHELGAAGLGLERMPDGSFTAITADASLWALPQATAEAPSRRFNAGPFDACAVAGQAAHDRWAWIDRGGNLLIASPQGGEIVRTRIEGFAEAPSRMAFSPSGRRLAIVGKARNDPLVIVDATTGTPIARLECSRQYAANALLWQDDDTLMRGDLGGTTIHHRDADGDWMAGTPLPANWSYARRASGESAFVFELVGAVQERDLRDGHRVKMFRGMSDMGFSAARSPDGTLVAAVGTDRRLHIWDNDTQEQLLSLSGHPAGRVVTGVEFSGDGQRVVTLDNQGGWVVWDTRHARERAEQPRLWDQ
jgi:YD repeat-containing protein